MVVLFELELSVRAFGPAKAKENSGRATICAWPELVQPSSGYVHRPTELLDRVVGIRTRYLLEFLVGCLLRGHAEALG
jgi:hypothetical protein